MDSPDAPVCSLDEDACCVSPCWTHIVQTGCLHFRLGHHVTLGFLRSSRLSRHQCSCRRNKWACVFSRSPFTGEYHELEQRWFPWQRTALSSKCSQYSGNVPDEATRRWVTFVCFICFRGPEEEQCAQHLLHKGVIHATAGSFISRWFIYFFVCSHT